MRSTVTRGFTVLWVAALVVALDQVTKFLIRANLEPGESIPAHGLVRLTYTTNTGGAFGLLSNQTFLLTLTAVVAVAALVFSLRYLPARSGWLKVCLGLEMGGAVGNLIDRLRLGAVTDFIDLGWWPVFNLADSAIVVGVVILVFLLLFPSRRYE